MSFDTDGSERYIEVKTTALGADTPLYISSAELDFAERHVGSYALYRIYQVLDEPKFFVLEGEQVLGLEKVPVSFRAWLPPIAGVP